MTVVSRLLSTVPTRENVKCRMWEFNRCFFFRNSIASIYKVKVTYGQSVRLLIRIYNTAVASKVFRLTKLFMIFPLETVSVSVLPGIPWSAPSRAGLPCCYGRHTPGPWQLHRGLRRQLPWRWDRAALMCHPHSGWSWQRASDRMCEHLQGGWLWGNSMQSQMDPRITFNLPHVTNHTQPFFTLHGVFSLVFRHHHHCSAGDAALRAGCVGALAGVSLRHKSVHRPARCMFLLFSSGGSAMPWVSIENILILILRMAP